MIKTQWNVEAVKAYETGQGVELVNEPYPHYEPLTKESEKQEHGEPKEWVGLTESERNDVVWSNTRADDLKEAYDVALAIEQALRNKNT